MDEPPIQALSQARAGAVSPAEVLRQQAADILASWHQGLRAGEDPAGASCPPRLAGHVPELLERLAEHLAAGQPATFQGSHPRALADLLAEEDVLAEVLREYAVLRGCLTATLLASPVDDVQGAVSLVHQVMDAEVGGAVALHIASRRRRDAHLERLLTVKLGARGMEELLQVLLGTSASIDSAAIYLLEGEELVRHAAVGHAPGPGRRWRVGEGLPGRSAAGQSAELRVAPQASEVEVPAGTRVVLLRPVVLDSRLVVGVVQMGSRSALDFLPGERRLLEALARRVATEVGALRLRELQARYARERHLEEDLALSEERFRTVFEDAAIGIAVSDVSGQLLRTNRALQELVGYGEAELRRMSIPDLTPPDDMARERQLFQELLEGRRGPYRMERRYIRKDRSVGWCRLTVSLGRAGKDRPPFIIGMVEDLTERRRAEELERTAEFRDRFLGVLGHDLRTPLNAISLSARRLLGLGLSAPAEASVRRIQASAERMARMIGVLLDVARSQLGGGMPVTRTRMDLAEAARAAVDELASVHPGRTIRCEVDGPVWGLFDPDRMAQVLANLLSNALQYSPPDSEVRVTVRDGEDWAELSVHNAGPPIPPEQLPHLFEPFRRATEEGSRSGNLGLGLFIVAQIVHAHGGTVSVRSTEEEGTTFTVRLPCVGGPGAPSPGP